MATASRKRGVTAACAASFLVPLVVYLFTLHPGVPGGDSGELMTVARILGVAHPPGYPLWTLLAHAWGSAFTLGTWAWRLNVLSALFMSLAAASLFAAIRILTGSAAAGLAASLAFAFSRPVWKYALVAEVFGRGDTLHNTIVYLQLVEGLRPDVEFADQELMTRTWYMKGLRRRHPDLLPSFGADDRYTGQGASRNLMWLDHLRGRRGRGPDIEEARAVLGSLQP